jgi:hypothetical protein
MMLALNRLALETQFSPSESPSDEAKSSFFVLILCIRESNKRFKYRHAQESDMSSYFMIPNPSKTTKFPPSNKMDPRFTPSSNPAFPSLASVAGTKKPTPSWGGPSIVMVQAGVKCFEQHEEEEGEEEAADVFCPYARAAGVFFPRGGAAEGA